MRRILPLLLCFLLLTGASTQKVQHFDNNSGGLNTRAGTLTVADNEATVAENFNFTTTGSIVKRKGNTEFVGGTPTRMQSGTVSLLGDYQLIDGTQKIVGASGDKVYKTDSTSDGDWDDITSGETVTAGNIFDWSQYRNIFVFTNGVDKVFGWDQTSSASDIKQLTIPTNLTAAFFTEIFSEFHFLGNVIVSATSHRSRIYYSNVGKVETWTATDFVDIGRDKAEGQITMMKTLGDRLVIGKQTGAIYNTFFTGDADLPFIIQRSFSQVGCGAMRSAVVVNNILFFWSTDGIGFYAYDGINSVEISEKIQPTLEGFASSRYADIIGEVFPELNQIWWSMTSTGSTHDRIVVFDYVSNAWSIHTGIDAAYLQLLEKGSELKMFSGNYGGRVIEQNISTADVNASGTDDTAIVATYKTKWFDLSNPALVKSLNHAIIYTQIESTEHSFNVGWGYDFDESDFGTLTVDVGGGGTTWGDENWGAFNWATSTGGRVKRLDLTGRGRFCRLAFSNSQASQPFTVDGFSLIYKEESLF